METAPMPSSTKLIQVGSTYAAGSEMKTTGSHLILPPNHPQSDAHEKYLVPSKASGRAGAALSLSRFQQDKKMEKTLLRDLDGKAVVIQRLMTEANDHAATSETRRTDIFSESIQQGIRGRSRNASDLGEECTPDGRHAA